MRRVVISGCSGGGKSALVNELAARGHAIVQEPGRRVIAAERASGGAGFPWDDEMRFATLAFWMSVGDHEVSTTDPTFFDRSALDPAAWFQRNGHPLPGRLPEYYETVFMTPPWPDIYHFDDDRRHSFEDAVAEHDDLMERLPAWGYDCRLLPKISVADRADWVLDTLDAGGVSA